MCETLRLTPIASPCFPITQNTSQALFLHIYILSSSFYKVLEVGDMQFSEIIE